MIVIIETGNVKSVYNMFQKIGVLVKVSSQIQDIQQAEKIVLPGVGSFDEGMKNLMNHGFVDLLQQKVNEEKIPFLGICLGMQMMCEKSEEGKIAGLGWMKAKVVRFDSQKQKVPHMGWNTVTVKKKNPLIDNLNHKFYFVHSYHVECENLDDILSTTFYGKDFVSGFQKDNLFGVQFHPEKSHRFGMQLLKNFSQL